MGDIIWPEGFLPGFTDNFVSNEIVVPNLSAAEVWTYLNDTRLWPLCYSHAFVTRFDDGAGPELGDGVRFGFTTFGVAVEAKVVEYVPPAAGQPARLAWYAWVDGDAESRATVHHAWLFEDLPGGRVRILTQETQNGKPARDLAVAKPNPMLNAHQEWIEGLARSAIQKASP